MLTENFYRSGEVNRIDTTNSLPVPITQPGTYKFKITNKAQWDWNGFLTVNLQFQYFEKPYFYWRIFGFAIAMGYIALVTTAIYKTRHKNNDGEVLNFNLKPRFQVFYSAKIVYDYIISGVSNQNLSDHHFWVLRESTLLSLYSPLNWMSLGRGF